MKISVSAPGKLMIMGEHAVIYGNPCIVTAVDKRITATAEITAKPYMIIKSSKDGTVQYEKLLSFLGTGIIPINIRFVEAAVKNFYDKYKIESGISISTSSTFSKNLGLGSSSAVTVAVLKAIAGIFNINISQEDLYSLSFKTIIDVQKKGSGFDVASAIIGGTIYFQTVEVSERLEANDLMLVVGFTGTKADTVLMMNQVSQKRRDFEKGVGKIFENIENLVKEAKIAIQDKNWERLGLLMNYNQNYLEDLGVSTDKLNSMILAANNAGAYGAKLSGAGGGDCMIALVDNKSKTKVIDAIRSVGGEILDLQINAVGVKAEREEKKL